MEPSELPIDALEKNYTVTTVLEGDTFTFDVRWNGRAASWFFDLYDVNGSIIIAGIRIVLGVILGRRSVDPRMPKGAIQASNLSTLKGDKGREATRDDLGIRVKLYYYPAALLESLAVE